MTPIILSIILGIICSSGYWALSVFNGVNPFALLITVTTTIVIVCIVIKESKDVF